MPEANSIAREIRAALEREPRINMHRSSIEISLPGEKVVLDGEVSDISEKRLATDCAKQIAAGKEVVDHLRVKPSASLGDGALRDSLANRLLDEPVFMRTVIVCRVAGDDDAIAREPNDPDGRIHAAVADGVVTLTGQVWSLSHRRLAEVLAWWTGGCRNVVNELRVEPPERDHDGEIADALELILNKDPLVHSDQIGVRVRSGRVSVQGIVATEEEKRMIERDIWYVEGVHDVRNELDIYRGPTGREAMPAGPPPHFE